MTKNTKEAFEQLGKVILQLTNATTFVNPSRLEKDGTIHRFEFCIELFWKTLQKKLQEEYDIIIAGPKPVLQQAFIANLIDDEKMWLDMLKDRNLTSHTYNQDLADEMYERIKIYAPFLQQQFDVCKNMYPKITQL